MAAATGTPSDRILPNYRGGFGRGEAFAAAVRGDVGGAEFADVMAVADAAVALRWVPP